MSVHGIKGKGFPVIIYIGFDSYFPRNDNINKPAELIDKSIMNVALTRSTKYLFIGFPHDKPSAYLNDINEELNTHCYTTWDIKPPPGIFKKIKDDVKNIWCSYAPAYPKFGVTFREVPLSVPYNGKMQIKKDIAQNTQVKKLFSSKHIDITEIKFADEIVLEMSSETSAILGFLGELLLRRLCLKNSGELTSSSLNFHGAPYMFLLNENNIYYTEDNLLLNIVTDKEINLSIYSFYQSIESADPSLHELILNNYLDIVKNKLLCYKNRYRAQENTIIECLRGYKYIINSNFCNTNVINSIKLFTGDVANSELSLNLCWNLVLLYYALSEDTRNISMYDAVNNPPALNIYEFHQNIQEYYDRFLSGKETTSNSPHIFIRVERDPETLYKYGFREYVEKKVNNTVYKRPLDTNYYLNGYEYGFVGFSDIINLTDNELIEIKTSLSPQCSAEWLIQVIMYSAIAEAHFDKITITNILSGVKYEVRFDVDFLSLLEEVLSIKNFDKLAICKLLKSSV